MTQGHIINDDELLETKMLLEDMLDGEDHIDRLLEIVNTVCSHPYNPQEQREKVLEQLIEYKKKILLRENDELDMRKRDFYEGLRRGVNYAIELLLELRQGGE